MTGLAVPSLVSLLTLYTNAESGAYSRYSTRVPRRRPYIFASTTHHRVSPEFIGSRNCGASSPQGSSSNGCCLCITIDQMLLCSSLFPHPLLVYSEYVQNISTAVVYCCTVCETVFSPRLIEFSVHGAISSYVVFQNIVNIAVL